MRVRRPEQKELSQVAKLAATLIGAKRAGPFVRLHAQRRQLLIAECDGELAGFLAYRTDWFGCTLITLTCVRDKFRRRGLARAMFGKLEEISPGPRVFSSMEETNTVSIQVHRALGFSPSGYVDNLPQGYRELLFYKRLEPRREAKRPEAPVVIRAR
jgi:GNAT superfamily N-acetyltransferase